MLNFLLTNECHVAGSKPGGHDRAERTRGRVPVCRSRLAADRTAKLGDAIACVQLSLSRTETRRHRRIGRIHPTRVEDAAESSQNLRAECK